MADPNAEAGGGRRFDLLRLLGEGTFGSVYLAEMEGAGGFKRRVALKLLNDAWDPSSDAGRRLRDEARLLGRLDHPNIVRVDDLVRVSGRWALIMEYVSGADVEAVFAWADQHAEPIPPRAALEICASVAAALEAAWEALGSDGAPLHVVHRDIKPSNVRLTDTGKVKVLDFGVARAEFAGREARTERIRYGSLGYMAPERMLGEPDAAPGDVYAVAVMAYELLTLKTFGRAELGLERQAAQVDSARDALENVVGDGPLVVLLVRALAYTPDDRPLVGELAEGLRRFAAALPGDDLPAYAGRVLPDIASRGSGITSALGTILEETSSGGSSLEMVPRVNSATLVVQPVSPGGFRSVDAPGVPPDSTGGPKTRRAPALVVGIATVTAILVFVLGWQMWSAPPAPDKAPTADAAPAITPEAAPPLLAGATVVPPAPAATATAASAELAVPARPPASPRTARAPLPASAAGAAASQAAPAGPRLRAAKFTLQGAEGIRVACGDVAATGENSALLRNFPAGDCTVVAAGSTTTVRVESPRGVACTLEGDLLECL